MDLNTLFADLISDDPCVKLSEICRSRSTECPARVRHQFFRFWTNCFVLLCVCSSVIAGDDILPVGRIVSESKVATAWQPIQAPAGAVPRDVARGHSPAHSGQLLLLQETVGSRTQSYSQSYDSILGRLTGITGPGYTQNFGYDAASRVILDQRQGDQAYEKLYRYDKNGNRPSSLITSGGSSTTLNFDNGLLPAAIIPRLATWAVTELALKADLGPQPSTLEGVASVSTESPTVVPSVAAGVMSTQVAYTASTSFAGLILRENATYRWQVGIVPQGDSAIIRGTRFTKKSKVELVLSESQSFLLPSHQVTLLATRISALNGWVVTAVEPSVSVLVIAPAAATTGFALLAQTPSNSMSTVRFDNVSWTIGGSRASRSSTFDRWNRLRKITGSENSEFAYDDRGRLLSKKTTTAASITEDLTSYDALARQTGFRRQVTATTPGATPQVKLDIGYAFYGTSTMRAGVKPATGALTTYAMDGTTMLSETTGTAQNRTRYFAGTGTSPLWQKESNGDLQTYLKDGQGNVTGQVKATTDVYRFAYDAYGVTTAKNATGTAITAPTGPRYRGAWFDSDTGQYQMGARFYTPGTGTFGSEDPIRADENYWAYCDGDPVNRSDLHGLDWEWNGTEWMFAGGDDVPKPHWTPRRGSDAFLVTPKNYWYEYHPTWGDYLSPFDRSPLSAHNAAILQANPGNAERLAKQVQIAAAAVVVLPIVAAEILVAAPVVYSSAMAGSAAAEAAAINALNATTNGINAFLVTSFTAPQVAAAGVGTLAFGAEVIAVGGSGRAAPVSILANEVRATGQVASTAGKAAANRGDTYQGVQQASAYLKSMGVPRAKRVTILQSFDIPTIKVRVADDATFGIRFHDFGKTAKPVGQFLNDTFSSLTNRKTLALPWEWNDMSGVVSWQIKPGTTYLTGKIGAQFSYGPQYVGGAVQHFVLEPWKYGTLLKP